MRCCFVTKLQRASQIHKVTLHGEDQSEVRNVTSSYTSISHKPFWITYFSWIVLNSFNLSIKKYMHFHTVVWKQKKGGGAPQVQCLCHILCINYYCICSLFYGVSSLHHLLVLSTLWMGIVCCWWMEMSGQFSSLLHVTNVQILTCLYSKAIPFPGQTQVLFVKPWHT